MKVIVVLFCIVSAILFYSCKDDAISPPSSTEFAVKISIKDSTGNPVAGLRISAWNHFPSSFWQGSHITKGILISPLAASQIQFSTATQSKINLSVFDFDGSLASTLVDGMMFAGAYTVQWNNLAHTPPRVYYYRMIAQDSATTVTLFRDSLFAVYWPIGADYTILGWSSLAGIFETSDKLLFPNVLNLPPLIRTHEDGPDSINTFIIPDSVTIALTDTLTGRQMFFDHIIKKDAINNIELIWNPTLSKQWAPYHPPMDDQKVIIRTNKPAMILLDWKLYQNYPNPFN